MEGTKQHTVAIRECAVEDLPKLAACAAEFYAASKFLKVFDLDRFCRAWEGFISSGMGVIFALECGADIVGVIGGISHEDLYGGQRVASEFFWFVQHDFRGTHGMRLYRTFEEWARLKECSQIRMACLMDSEPEQMATLYTRLGYQLCEQQFVKELE